MARRRRERDAWPLLLVPGDDAQRGARRPHRANFGIASNGRWREI